MAGSSPERDASEWLEYLLSRLDPRGGGAPFATACSLWSGALEAVARSRSRRNPAREQFVLLAEQRLAYDLVLHAVDRAREADRSGSSSSPADREAARASSRCRCSASWRGAVGRCCTPPARARSRRRCERWLVTRSPPTQRLFKYFNELHGR